MSESERSDPRSSLGIILARLLLEMQGATLVCTADAGAWTARIEFPGRA